ncbi:uncharacterized protein LOC135480610 [Liolophura sinensis]|uniref:uncharacterized protein LOC135480610 n=1 Tax=Liolophura sinensis TaxID=3198878 RepID=UPI003159781A
MIAVTKAVTILLLVTVVFCQPCPKKCHCRQKQMTCSNLSEFPEYIPESTEKVILWYLKLDEIPSDAFSSLSNVTKIEIYKSEIKYLKGCTFSFLSDIHSLTLHSVRVQEIQPFAFHSLSNIEKLTLYNVTVDVIHPNAFFNISLVTYFEFHNVSVKLFDSYAVRKLREIGGLSVFNSNIKKLKNNAFFELATVESFSIGKNRIEELECRTVESLSMTLPSFFFYNNEMECSCSLSWLLRHVRNPRNQSLRYTLKSNSCKGQKKRVTLSDLTASDFSCGQETLGYCFSSPPPVSSAPCAHVPQETITNSAHPSTSAVSSRGQTVDYRSPSTSDGSLHLSPSVRPDTTAEHVNGLHNSASPTSLLSFTTSTIEPTSFPVTDKKTTVPSATDVGDKMNPVKEHYPFESSSRSLLPTVKLFSEPISPPVSKSERLTTIPSITDVNEKLYHQDVGFNSTSATVSATPQSGERPTIMNLPLSKKTIVADTTVNGRVDSGQSPEMTQSGEENATPIPKVRTPSATRNIRVPLSPTSDTVTGETKASSPAPISTKAMTVGSRSTTVVSRQAESESDSKESRIMDDRQAFEKHPKYAVKPSGGRG